MKHPYLSLIALASMAACAIPTSSEGVGVAEQADHGGGGHGGGHGGGGSSSSSSGGGSSSSSSGGGGGSSCSPSAQDDQNRAAATVALHLMRLVAPTVPAGWAQNYPLSQTQGFSVLASQRYRLLSSGTGIEFDPNDPLYNYVTSAMKAELLFAQDDAGVAKFLSDGLKAAYANTDGKVFPEIRSIGALANYTGGTKTVTVSDPTVNSPGTHTVTLTTVAQACGVKIINLAETVQNSWQYAPLFGASISLWTGNVPAGFKGSQSAPTTPFNGPSGNNPLLVVSMNGSSVNWSGNAFPALYCYNYPGNTCTGSIQIDPAAYAEPGNQYDVNNVVMGTQANPFPIDQGYLYGDPSHAANWATRTVNGTQEWGTFTNAVNKGGVTMYRYVKQF